VSQKPVRLWLIRLALMVTMVVVFVGSIEVAGRMYIWWKHGVPGKSYGLWQYDAELGAIHASNSYNTGTQTNNYGFRGREDVFEPKPPGSRRFICYGGSMTFCYNLADGETWPERLQEHLRAGAGHERDQVLNGGHIIWSTGHLYRQALRDLPALRPDYVVLYTGVNDITNAQHLILAGYDLDELDRQQQYGVMALNYDQNRWLKRNSVLVRFFEYRLRVYLRGGETGPTPHAHAKLEELKKGWSDDEFKRTWIWKNYLFELGRFVRLIRENGGTPIFVIEAGLPDEDTPNEPPEPSKRSTKLWLSAHAADVMRQDGVIVCDPRSVILADPNRKDLFHSTGAHVSAEGAKILAEQIAKSIESAPRKDG
jgi:lysophospholipase L1-like esterase